MPEMKECCTCHVLLPVSEFNRRAKASDGLQSRCRACAREWYVNNRAEHGRSTRERSQAVRTELAMKINQYLLSNPCVDCGETDIRCLDFDHREPAMKVSAVCRMVANQKPWPVILSEIAKCDVRCANCHRRRTAEQFNTIRHRIVANQIHLAPGA